MILVVVEDLIFLSKIQHTAQAMELALETASAAEAFQRAKAGSAQAILIDLSHSSGDAVDLVRRIKADPSTMQTRVVGYLSHVQTDLAAAARAAGCDMVLARSTFTQKLPEILRSLSGRAAGGKAPTDGPSRVP